MKISIPHTGTRALILVVAALLLLGNIFSLTTWSAQTDPLVSGTLGGRIRPGLVDQRLRIDSVDAGGALAMVGAQVGDLIVFRHPGVLNLTTMTTGQTIDAVLYTPAGAKDVSLHPQALPPATSPASLSMAIMDTASTVMAIALAVILVLRKGRDPAMLAFAASLLANAPAEFQYHLPVGTLQDWSTLSVRALDYCAGYWFFLLFALMYPSENALWKRKRVAPAMLLFGAVFLACSYAMHWSRLGMLHIAPAFAGTLVTATGLMAVGTAMTTLGVLVHSWMKSRGSARDRIGWILLSIGFTYLMWIWVNITGNVGFDLPTLSRFTISAVNFLGFLGFAYALFRHRIFDFGFAVNRALVYTCISTLLLLVFAVTEFAVDKMLHFQGREKNIIFDAIVALIVILSFHRIQHWIAHRVDHTFFHHWHEAAERLRHAFEQLAHVTSADVLVERAASAMMAFTGADRAAMYELDGDGNYRLRHASTSGMPAEIGVDHPLAVALRHRAELKHADETGLLPALAVPLVLRGTPSGLILLAGAEGRLALRPDQSTLLSTMAATLAMQLEAVRIHELDRHARQLREQAASLQHQLRDSEREARDLRSGMCDLRDANAALRALAGLG